MFRDKKLDSGAVHGQLPTRASEWPGYNFTPHRDGPIIVELFSKIVPHNLANKSKG